MAVPHLTLDLGAGHQGSDGVDDDDVERAGPDQHVGDLERLLAGIGLGHQQRVGVDAQPLGVLGVEGVRGVDERRDAPQLLRAGHRVQRDGGLARRLRAVDLDDAPARQPPDAERDVERDRPGGDHLQRRADLVAESHHRALAELLVDVGERSIQSLVAVRGSGHVVTCSSAVGPADRVHLSSGTTLGDATDIPPQRRPICGQWDEPRICGQP